MSPAKIHLPPRTWSRRTFLGTSAALVTLPWLDFPAYALVRRHIKLAGYPFTLGVASGDPTPEGFVIWTRLAIDPVNGGGMPVEKIEVGWQVAHDEQMTQIAAHGTAVATPEMAHAVHVEVPGLEANRWYYYRFQAAGEISPVGRARTAPPVASTPDRLRLAFASCQHYEQGLFTAYEHMAREDLDLVAHLGDYIYEYPGKDRLVRKHTGGLLTQTWEYRNRFGQYKSDRALQQAHQMCPWIVTWDDHEFSNNYANLVSEKATDPVEFRQRRANAYQAYYEHMPLRAAQLPNGPDLTLYRSVQFGQLADFAVLDTRQYRTDQPCNDGNKAPCEETFAPQATLLGENQERWLFHQLERSKARWNVLTQQVMMARVDRNPGDEQQFSMDQWPGYEANRQRVLKFFAEHPKLNPIVITGDIHSNWVNHLQLNSEDEKSPVVGTEFVGTSISSGGDGVEAGKGLAALLSQNRFVRYWNGERGYVSCEITPAQWVAHYRTVPFVTRAGAPLVTRKSFVVEQNRPGVHEV